MRRAGLAAAALLAALCACEGKKPGVTAALVVDAGPPLPEEVRLFREANAALQAGRLDEAIAKSQDLLKLEPEHPIASNTLGRALMLRFEKQHRREDAEGARAAFEAVLKVNPTFWPALQNLGALAEEQNQLAEAARYYQRLLEAQPKHPERERLEQLIAAVDAGR